MDSPSPYLAQAIAAMAQQPQAQSQGISLSPDQIRQFQQKAKQFRAANPDGNFMGHQLMQAGRNVMDAPGNAMSNLTGLFGMGARPPGAVPALPPGTPPIQPPY